MGPHTIREKRRISFSDLRITPGDIRALSNFLEEEALRCKADRKKHTLYFSVDANDGCSYESISVTIFKEGGVIKTKSIKQIKMHLVTEDYSKNLEIYFTQGLKDQTVDNYALVSGDDPNWVTGALDRINELVNTIEPQPRIQRVVSIANLIVWAAALVTYYRVFWKDAEGLKNETLSLILTLGVVVGIFWCYYAMGGFFERLLPVVELQTGPEHLQLPKAKRRKVIAVFSLIVIPIIITLVYDLVKAKFF